MIQANRTVGHRVYTEGAVNARNDATFTWAPAVDVAVYGWAPVSPTEEHDAGRNPVEIVLQLFGPADSLSAVGPRDRFVVDGATYEVEGAVENFNSGPFGYEPGVRINLKRVEG